MRICGGGIDNIRLERILVKPNGDNAFLYQESELVARLSLNG